MPSSLVRLVSTIICIYVRYCPIEKGKWRLLKWASPFLVVELEPNIFVRMTMNSSDPVEAALARTGLLESRDVRVFLSLLKPGMTVFDLGANLGMYTVLAARRVGPGGWVHAFEPSPEVVSRLQNNVHINGLTNVVVNNAAVADSEELVTLYLQRGSDRNTLAAGAGTPIKVRGVTLDGYLRRTGLLTVDVMKVDVEGAELTALRGAATMLASDGAPLIMIEFNPKALKLMGASEGALFDALTSFGYSCYRLNSYGELPDRYCNVLALKDRHRSMVPPQCLKERLYSGRV